MVRVASIRLAEVRDAAAIAHVHVESWLTTYEGIVPRAYLATLNEAERVPLWEDWLTRDVSVFVAELDGDVVGFSGAGAIREPFADYDAELYTLYLLEGRRGAASGGLFWALSRRLWSGRLTGACSFGCWENPAVHLYEKAGAQHLARKQIEIGGASLTELALGWPDVRRSLAAGRYAQAPRR